MPDTSPAGPGSVPEARLEAILDEFAAALRRGESPSLADYAARHPELKSGIEKLVPALELIGAIQGSARREPSTLPHEPARMASVQGRLGEYTLLREIGRGGMGIVYEARQESLQRSVAVKVLPLHALLDERSVERFRREARAAASLEHPNIVAVHGLHAEGGVHFYVMSYVEGAGTDAIVRILSTMTSRRENARPGENAPAREDLSSSLAAGLLTQSLAASWTSLPEVRELPGPEVPQEYFLNVARLGARAADALAYAHERGILHRDIKPSNLLLDVRGKVWVTDFGLAKVIGADDLTGTGEIPGTLRYMAPERFQGRADHQSDVYSLGLTLHELLTFQRPFAGQEGDQIIREIQSGSLPSPSDLNRAIPQVLSAIVLKATAKLPANRYGSSRELARDLERFAGGEKVRVRRAFRPLAARSFSARLRWRAVAVVALLLLLVATLAVGLFAPLEILRPADLLLSDLDGDGAPEVVVAGFRTDEDTDPGSVLIFKNDHHGAFTAQGQISGGVLPFALAAEDFDGDGRKDLALSSKTSMEIQLFLQSQDGSFLGGERLQLRNHPLRLAARDLDGDGRPDLAAVFQSSDEVRLWKNVGGAKLSEAAPLRSGAGPSYIEAASMNGDPHPDLVLSNTTGKSLSVLVNRGEWRFESREYPLPDVPMGFAAFDADGDADLDIAVSLSFYTQRPFRLLRNRGDGTLGDETEHALPYKIESFAAGDFDADSRVDLAAVGDASYFCILRNLGGGAFAPPVSLGGAQKPNTVGTADLDGDKDLDLVVSNCVLGGGIATFQNDGKGGFQRGAELKVSYRRGLWSGW